MLLHGNWNTVVRFYHFKVDHILQLARIQQESSSIKFAIAGRNEEKLKKTLVVAQSNTGMNFANIDTILVDVNNPESIVSMAEQTKIVINCVGPVSIAIWI